MAKMTHRGDPPTPHTPPPKACVCKNMAFYITGKRKHNKKGDISMLESPFGRQTWLAIADPLCGRILLHDISKRRCALISCRVQRHAVGCVSVAKYILFFLGTATQLFRAHKFTPRIPISVQLRYPPRPGCRHPATTIPCVRSSLAVYSSLSLSP
ncbi:hypothetical protein BS50DRAFT_343347 [Corynespora cassiicola Philippines]|uniref:Uncharacterized protein n=1 Tax=Corynespora cassiicola Philippines TaxID=1448308 RepID=A0A2T2NVU0_CORCC|nr:hypothetical protein BS50DRAFT_343347 [Corynespora cassiicola Philippines]